MLIFLDIIPFLWHEIHLFKKNKGGKPPYFFKKTVSEDIFYQKINTENQVFIPVLIQI